jgi:hypothetical protein
MDDTARTFVRPAHDPMTNYDVFNGGQHSGAMSPFGT